MRQFKGSKDLCSRLAGRRKPAVDTSKINKDLCSYSLTLPCSCKTICRISLKRSRWCLMVWVGKVTEFRNIELLWGWSSKLKNPLLCWVKLNTGGASWRGLSCANAIEVWLYGEGVSTLPCLSAGSGLSKMNYGAPVCWRIEELLICLEKTRTTDLPQTSSTK